MLAETNPHSTGIAPSRARAPARRRQPRLAKIKYILAIGISRTDRKGHCIAWFNLEICYCNRRPATTQPMQMPSDPIHDYGVYYLKSPPVLHN